MFFSVCCRVSEPQHYWHFALDDSMSWGLFWSLWGIGQHRWPLPTACSSFPSVVATRRSPDIAQCPLVVENHWSLGNISEFKIVMHYLQQGVFSFPFSPLSTKEKIEISFANKQWPMDRIIAMSSSKDLGVERKQISEQCKDQRLRGAGVGGIWNTFHV